MWDKLVTRERERQLGLLFGCGLIAAGAYGILAEQFPAAAKILIGVFGLALLVLFARAMIRLWRKPGPAPTGPLSSDERIKARSKLKNAAHPPDKKPGQYRSLV